MSYLRQPAAALLLAASVAASSEPSGTPGPSGLNWVRHGVALDLGSQGAIDERGLESPIVMREAPDRLVMWYRGRTFADDQGRIMRAVSGDGLNWTGTGIVMEPEGPLEGSKIDPMTVALDEDGVYMMWYGAAGRGGNASLATSADGISWTRSPRNPVLAKTSRQWDSRGAGGQHSVVRVGNRWEMIYKGFGDQEGWTHYGLAHSRDGERWKKRGRRISPDPSIGENTLFRNLFAFYRDGRYYVIHAMAGRDNLNLRLLHSTNGKKWQRGGIIFAKGLTPGGYDVKWATSPTLLFENGRVRMWYEGGDADGKVRLLYAETDEAAFFERALRGPDD